MEVNSTFTLWGNMVAEVLGKCIKEEFHARACPFELTLGGKTWVVMLPKMVTPSVCNIYTKADVLRVWWILLFGNAQAFKSLKRYGERFEFVV
jgi:hypothetical protein